MDKSREVVISDLAAACGDTREISKNREMDKWHAVSYETAEVSGVMLSADCEVNAEPVTFDPRLAGWYDIWVGMYAEPALGGAQQYEGYLKLKSDLELQTLTPSKHLGRHKIDEFLWRAADMTGETLTLGHPHARGSDYDTAFAFFRFVPLDDEAVARRRAEFTGKRHKKIFATHDMHWFMYFYNPQRDEDWLRIPYEYIDSDVESLSIEYLNIFDGDIFSERAEDCAFAQMGDRNVQEGLRRFFLRPDPVYSKVIERGHDLGLEMYMGLRMGAWAIEFPLEGGYFDRKFARENPHLRCVDRDGTALGGLSYAYPEVQENMLFHLSHMLSFGCDGVSLIYTRGTPYVLFEQPVLDLFAQRYPDVDARHLPNTDPRLEEVRVGIMNGFMRRVRSLLDAHAAGGKRLLVNAHVHTSVADNLYYGLDIKTWVDEGLVDKLIVNNDRHWENLDADVWQDEEHTLIDLKKYACWARSAPESVSCRNVFDHDIPAEAIEEYLAIAKDTGVRIICDVQTRHLPFEKAQREVLRFIENGVESFCMWDTYQSKPVGRNWAFASRVGHTDEVAGMTAGDCCRTHRVLSLAGIHVGRYFPSWGG